MFANVQGYCHGTSRRDAPKKLGKNDAQVPVPVTGAFHLASSKLLVRRAIADGCQWAKGRTL
ncbi:MAG: hypothetical protein ABSA12_10590 [Verrucomicrobiia bacterium]|jgi:hypothetical protein